MITPAKVMDQLKQQKKNEGFKKQLVGISCLLIKKGYFYRIKYIKMETTKTLQKIDSLVLCEYIVKYHGPMSHLKLQKLLFYCDAYHLAYFDTELVSDKFQAWVHGPVSRKVYDSLKDKSILHSELKYSYVAGDIDVDVEFGKLTKDQQDLLKDVLDNLSQWTGFQLETATHKESPWLQARLDYGPADRCEVLISKDLTKDFYKKELSGQA